MFPAVLKLVSCEASQCLAYGHGDRRGHGIGTRLGSRFLDDLDQPQVRVVVGAANTGAISAYEKLRFVRAGSIEVHAGEPSVELLWSRSP